MVAKVGVACPEQVCEYLQLDSSTLSRNVERMRARGWLETVAAEDGRLQPFRLTTEGKKLLSNAAPRGSGAWWVRRWLLGAADSRARRGCRQEAATQKGRRRLTGVFFWAASCIYNFLGDDQ